MSKETVITAQNVCKSFRLYSEKPRTLKDRTLSIIHSRYTTFRAINDVSMSIQKGETVGLIGKNGSGKSTMLKLFTSIIYPDSGSISVRGRVSSLIELGAGFHPDFTGRENIYVNSAIFGMSKRQTDEIYNSIVEFSGIESFIDNPVRTYSSGMYMRLAFSVAIHVNPEILLIDEILSVGDAEFQRKCFEKIDSFRSSGTTIVIVSHDTDTLEKLCTKCYWMDGGEVRMEGSARDVIAEYKHVCK